MSRLQQAVTLAGFLSIGALAYDSRLLGAEEGTMPSPLTKTQVQIPVGLRIQNAGNSWSYSPIRLRAMEAVVGIKGGMNYPHAEVIDGKSVPIYLAGGLNGKRTDNRQCVTLKAKLEAGKIDVFTYSHSSWHEIDNAEEIAEFGIKHNKDFRVVWQAGWMVHDGLRIAKNGPARDAVRIADLQVALDKARKPIEAKVEAINKKLGRRVVTIVPVGDAFVKLRTMVVEGTFPGVKKQSELFDDDMPHQGRLGGLLQDYCTFAALYHKSPVGLVIPIDKGISTEQNSILQKIAWETVSNYSHGGKGKPTLSTPTKTPTQQMEFFEVAGQRAFVILPGNPDSDKPIRWMGYTPCLLGGGLPGKSEDWMFERFLAAGIAIAGIDAGDCSGNPRSRELFAKLHAELVKNRRFSSKPALLARSRGGLFAFNWAAEHPEQVSCIACIYPVCDLRSYPGLGNAAKHYGLTPAELEKQLEKHNPVYRLAPLAKAKVPLFSIHGDVDKIVPLETNSAAVEKRYRELGGSMRLIVPKGQGHNFWRGFFECEELVEFVIKNAK